MKVDDPDLSQTISNKNEEQKLGMQRSRYNFSYTFIRLSAGNKIWNEILEILDPVPLLHNPSMPYALRNTKDKQPSPS